MPTPTAGESPASPHSPDDGDAHSLVGRGHDLEAVRTLLSRSRLVSLTGPGGSGKTRLARAAIAELIADGQAAWFVDASKLEDPAALVPAVVAAVAPSADAQAEPVDALADAIGDTPVTVVLDNLEQVVGAGQAIEVVLARVSALRVIATSRVPLRSRTEHVYPVPPLELPAGDAMEAIQASPAGALFMARASQAGFRLGSGESAGDIARVLRRLDGLPLAIELAAARTRLIRPAEILYWLDESGLAAVDSPADDAHRSLRMIVDWTVGLLGTEEASVLSAVSVAAGFDLRLAKSLAPDSDVLNATDTLVAVGLVKPAGDADGASRFELLETIRAEVTRRMTDGDLARYRARHAEAMLAAIPMLESRIRGVDQPAAQARLDADADNFRLALDWLSQTGPPRALDLWTGLDMLWRSHHRQREGMARFEELEGHVGEPTVQLARAMSRYVGLAFDIRGSVRSKDLNERALDLAREVGDPVSEVEALGGAVMAAVMENDLDTVRSASEEVERIVERLDDPDARWTAAQARCFAAMALHGAASDEMQQAYEAAVDIAAASGRRDLEMNARGNLGVVLVYRQSFRAASEHLSRAVELARQTESHLLNWALATNAIALAETGRVDEAVAALIEAASDVAVLAVPERIADVLTAGTAVAVAAGEPVLAASWRGTIDAIYAADPSIAQPENVAMLDRIMSRARRGTREVELSVARAKGRDAEPLGVLQALPEQLARQAARAESRPMLRHGELTRREVEVLTMVGEGKTDGDIAAALFISPKTASVHVSNVKAKLGAASRVELAMHARSLGLISREGHPPP